MSKSKKRASDIESNNSISGQLNNNSQDESISGTIITKTKKKNKRGKKRKSNKAKLVLENLLLNVSASSVTKEQEQIELPLLKKSKLVKTDAKSACTIDILCKKRKKSLSAVNSDDRKTDTLKENVETFIKIGKNMLEGHIGKNEKELISNPKSSDERTKQSLDIIINEDESEVTVGAVEQKVTVFSGNKKELIGYPNSHNEKRKCSLEETNEKVVKKQRLDSEIIEIEDISKDEVFLHSSFEAIEDQQDEKCESDDDTNWHKGDVVEIDSSDFECLSVNSDIEFVSEDKPTDGDNSVIIINDLEQQQFSFNKKSKKKLNKQRAFKNLPNSLISGNMECRNSIGRNIFCNTENSIREGLREIVIDGSNVAIGHSNGHKVTAFVPQYRLKQGQCSCPSLLKSLGDKRYVIFTPSRDVEGRRITPYDDRFIVQYAHLQDGIIVSNDNYRDLLAEKPEWRRTIENNILMFTWVDNILIFPEDPLGRSGPRLDDFLKFR